MMSKKCLKPNNYCDYLWSLHTSSRLVWLGRSQFGPLFFLALEKHGEKIYAWVWIKFRIGHQSINHKMMDVLHSLKYPGMFPKEAFQAPTMGPSNWQSGESSNSRHIATRLRQCPQWILHRSQKDRPWSAVPNANIPPAKCRRQSALCTLQPGVYGAVSYLFPNHLDQWTNDGSMVLQWFQELRMICNLRWNSHDV